MASNKYLPDSLDVQIVTALAQDGRLSFRNIAEDIGISDQTVRYRFAHLVEHGILRVAPLLNPFYFDDSMLSSIGLQLETRTQEKTMEEISKLKGIVSVCNTTGEFDLIVEVFHGSRGELNRFLFDELPKVEGIKSTHSFICLEGKGKWIPVSNVDVPARFEHRG